MDLELDRAFSIVMQTKPYIVYRATIYGAMVLAFAVFLGVVGLIGLVFGGAAAMITLVGCLVAAGILGLGRLLGEYVLYMLKAGHIALITEIVENGKLPDGISQTDWAKERVTQYFKEVSVLAVIDQLVKGIIRVMNRTLFNVLTALPIPGMEGAAKAGQRIVDFSLTYVDEAVIAHTFKTKNENVYDAAKTGIVLYAQCWKGILKNAVALTLLSYVFVFVCFLVFLVPLGVIALLLPASMGGAKFGLFIFAVFLGFSLKWILFDPIACTATILTFLKACEGQVPNPEWEGKIEAVSGKFRELKDKAAEKFQEMSGSRTGISDSPGE